ncbi:preprotein translocase subunit SecG [Wansuia hejianensis]|uniref:Protein-export membrane protein SecG n=1 Tax=Wansuia hejianensis TaxID=2763667 RepID=A0A926EZV6_9FIRM|nr:preprotein translocase subunit SecG [Wansuia hejianensis]MBC8591443.1 preprotein translocase subunit SecG [Wansuia hejianensis]
MQTFFSILLLISALGVIVSVMLQEGSDGSMSALGGGNSFDSLWGSNRGKSKEAILQRVTTISAVVFMISTVILAAK